MLCGEGVGGDRLSFFIQNRFVEHGLLCGRQWAGPEPTMSSGANIPGTCPDGRGQ